MKNLSALVAALLLIVGLSVSSVMAYNPEMSEEDYELEQVIFGEEE